MPRDTFAEAVKRVSKKLNKDPRVVSFVGKQQFRYIARKVISDPDAERSYRALHLGAFIPKFAKRKKDYPHKIRQLKKGGVEEL